MTEPARISCCIQGCRRTFKPEALDGDCNELMCGPHYRCEPPLVAQRKHVQARRRRINRLARKIQRRQGGEMTNRRLARLDALWEACDRRDNRLWATIKAVAQMRQDAGFFAPKPRRRAVIREDRTTDPLASRFEDQFQRLKRAAGGGAC